MKSLNEEPSVNKKSSRQDKLAARVYRRSVVSVDLSVSRRAFSSMSLSLFLLARQTLGAALAAKSGETEGQTVGDEERPRVIVRQPPVPTVAMSRSCHRIDQLECANLSDEMTNQREPQKWLPEKKVNRQTTERRGHVEHREEKTRGVKA